MTDQISDAAASEAINPSCFTCVTCADRHRRHRFGPPQALRPAHGRAKVTYRVGGAGIAGERQGLAAAAAEIQLATQAACARLVIPAQPRRRRGPQSITTGSDYGCRDRGHAAKLAQAAYTCLRCPRPGRVSRTLCGLLSQLQELFVGQAAQQRADVHENFLARRRVALREIVDESRRRSSRPCSA